MFTMKNTSAAVRWYEYILWAGIGALAAIILTYIFNVTGLTSLSSYVEANEGLFGVSKSIPVLIVLYCLVTPVLEEIIFRYFIFNLLKKRIKKAAVSILITAALFGIYHLNPVQMLYGFLMGLLITYSYYKRPVLTIPITVHAAANAVALAYTFL